MHENESDKYHVIYQIFQNHIFFENNFLRNKRCLKTPAFFPTTQSKFLTENTIFRLNHFLEVIETNRMEVV